MPLQAAIKNLEYEMRLTQWAMQGISPIPSRESAIRDNLRAMTAPMLRGRKVPYDGPI